MHYHINDLMTERRTFVNGLLLMNNQNWRIDSAKMQYWAKNEYFSIQGVECTAK